MNLSQPNVSPIMQAYQSITAFLDKLTLPHSSVTNEEERQRSRLLSYFLLVTILISPAVVLFQLTIDRASLTNPDMIGAIIAIGFAFILYMINRRGRHTSRAAAVMIGFFAVASVIIPFLEDASESTLAFANVSMLLTGMFFARRAVIWVSAGVLVLVIIMNSLVPNLPIKVLFYYLIFSSAMITTFVYYIQYRESLRRQRLEEANVRLIQSEEALHALNSELEARVEARTRDLEAKNQELERAWEAAKKADLVKSQFLASMSHELRTPLNAILNFTEFVTMGMMGSINERQKDALDKSLESGRHLLSLINDVLDITKIESGMLRMFVETSIDLTDTLEAVQTTARTLLKGKPVEFRTHIDAPLPLITGDKRRLRQVLLNLISNACKFTEEGEITLSVINEGSSLLVSVRDSGPGIKQEDFGRIFEPFQQTETGIKHTGGTGLGLAISKRLVEAHDGELWVESEVGQGSTFFFRIPLQPESLTVSLQSVGGLTG